MPCLLDCLIVGVSNTDKCCKRKKIFYDYHRRKRSEKNEVIPVETQGMLIVNKLRTQYMEELVRDIKRQQEEYQ